MPKNVFLKRTFISLELDKLSTVFYYLQQSAISSNRKEYLYFNEDSYYFNDRKEFLSKDVKFSFEDCLGPPSNAYKNLKDFTTFKNRQVIFYPNGKISPGVVYLTDSYTNAYCLSVGISQISYLRKYKKNSSNWVLIK